jgi:hypothetical protein
MKSSLPVCIVATIVVLFTSCQIRTSCIKSYYDLVNEQTVFIETIDIAKASRCTENGSPTGSSSEICNMLMKSLPDIRGEYVGSGTFIRHEGKIRVLTAEHVCFPDEVPDKVEKEVVTIYVSKSSSITIRSGDFKATATIVRKSKELDLCILEISDQPIIRAPSLSLYTPKRGDYVFYGGAPYGMISESFLLTYGGHFSGTQGKNMLFSLPCAPGASGSSIRNSKNEIVSMVQKVHTEFSYICYGISTTALRDFVFKRSTQK